MQVKYNTEAIILLARWVKEKNLSIADLSRESKVKYDTLYKMFNGDHRPHLLNAIKIEVYTNGEVPCTAWAKLNLQLLKKPRKKPTEDNQSNDGA